MCWGRQGIQAGKAFKAGIVIGGAGRGRRRLAGALEGIPRGWCSGAEQLWVRCCFVLSVCQSGAASVIFTASYVKWTLSPLQM